MPDVVGVHGIGKQQSGRNQLLAPWTRAFADGIERAAGLDAAKPTFDIAYYGDLFLSDSGTKGTDADEPSDVLLDSDAVQWFQTIEEELVGDQPLPEPVPTKSMKEVPKPVARLASWLDAKFGVAGRLLFFGDLVQVRRYQGDDELAEIARARMHEVIGPDTRTVIGHSLGSLVAYEYLCLTSDHPVENLVTLGSPLGLSSIQRRLRTLDDSGQPKRPQGAVAWTNVYDPSDAVACAGGLSPTWPNTVDRTVDNEGDPHPANRYLGKAETGRAVLGLV